jgi:hypothetical protein
MASVSGHQLFLLAWLLLLEEGAVLRDEHAETLSAERVPSFS